MINNLTEAKALHFPKERLRLSSGTLRKTSNKPVENSVDRVISAISNKVDKEKKVVKRKGNVEPGQPAIIFEEKTQTISVYEEHPSFLETIEFENRQFKVQYDQWALSKTPFRICKLSDDQSTVIFNRSHPLFESKLNENIVKRLSLGIFLILSEVDNNDFLIES